MKICENIFSLEVEGTFDDCQNLVKQAFLNEKINASITLSSANSINISRLIPQTFYYFKRFKHLIVRSFKNSPTTQRKKCVSSEQ